MEPGPRHGSRRGRRGVGILPPRSRVGAFHDCEPTNIASATTTAGSGFGSDELPAPVGPSAPTTTAEEHATAAATGEIVTTSVDDGALAGATISYRLPEGWAILEPSTGSPEDTERVECVQSAWKERGQAILTGTAAQANGTIEYVEALRPDADDAQEVTVAGEPGLVQCEDSFAHTAVTVLSRGPPAHLRPRGGPGRWDHRPDQ